MRMICINCGELDSEDVMIKLTRVDYALLKGYYNEIDFVLTSTRDEELCTQICEKCHHLLKGVA